MTKATAAKRQHRCGPKCSARCSICDKAVHRGKGSRLEIICRPCRRARPGYRPHRPPRSWTAEQRTCPICGASFTQQRWGQRYCTEGCKNRRDRNYTPATLERRRQYNRDRNAAALKRKRERGRDHRHKARRLGVASEPYTLAEIAKRDRYRCGLCRRPVVMTKTVPNPKAPTIDHVVPLAAGGDDTRANVQLAHYRCNYLKGDRGGGEQLKLIG